MKEKMRREREVVAVVEPAEGESKEEEEAEEITEEGSSSVMNNGPGERLMCNDSEHGYDGPAGEQFLLDGPPTGSNTSVREIEEFSQRGVASSWQVRGRSENDQLSETTLDSYGADLIHKRRGIETFGSTCLPVGWHSVCSNGSHCPGSDIIGAGGLVRNNAGVFICRFRAKHVGFFAFQAELLGVY